MGSNPMAFNNEPENTESNGVKYHLVEAEEIPCHISPPKKYTNWAADDENPDTTKVLTKHQSESRPRQFRGRGRGGRFPSSNRGGRGYNNRYQGPRYQHDRNGTYLNGVYIPNADIRITAQWAKSQIEFYFTPDNLVKDIFLRQHMDVEGYVPLAFVGSFQAVYSIHQHYNSLLEAMKTSEIVELDEENELIRLRHGWDKWLWPNAEGGYGVSRYVKMDVPKTDENQE